MGRQNDQLTRQRLQRLLRYRQALDVGDLATVAAILRLAEDDPVLEAQLLEVDSLSQAEDGVTASANQLLLARGLLSTLRAEAQYESKSRLLDSSSNPQPSLPDGHRTNQDGQMQPLQQEPYRLSSTAGGVGLHGSRRTRFASATGFMRSAAALLVVGALIAAFLAILTQHVGSPRHTASSVPTGTPHDISTPHGIYFSRSDGVYRLDIQDRTVIWHTQVPGLSTALSSTITVIGDTVFIDVFTRPQPGAPETPVVYGIDAETGQVRWTHDFLGQITGPFVDDGLVYFGNTLPNKTNALYLVDPANGLITAMYAAESLQVDWAQGSAWALADGYVYYLSNSTLVAVQLSSQKVVWQQPVGYPAAAAIIWPIVAQNGVVYVTVSEIYSEQDRGLVEAFNTHTGSKLWQTPLLPGGISYLFVTDNTMYVPLVGELLAFSTQTHVLVWQGPYDTYNVLPYAGRLYLFCCANIPQIAVVDPTTGHLLWGMDSTTLGMVLASIYNGVVYTIRFGINGHSGTIFALDAATGKQLWTMSTGVPTGQWGDLVVD